MRKKIITAAVIMLVLLILFVPIPLPPLKEGGTRQYAALTYKVVKWQRAVDGEIYKKTSVYFFPDNFKSIDELWAMETNDTE
ncbi:hypothetical protein [Ruminococcus albus]|uniref:Uncharacterized protein n=1 Tax=Ruminococcus albus (strain ATCC 27210 / DSM 20455 / JCM 14654 / NCDO 2250 / 7) TaxID=697329 RepID=E6UIK0_RUMA7|nr:hypothetical protein [Ruminococcus albus]ADU23345.1 hypothetical protein Rumal_2879 [Ruminococcus albus 7 = DSM 20455]